MDGAWFDLRGGRGDYDRHMDWQGPLYRDPYL